MNIYSLIPLFTICLLMFYKKRGILYVSYSVMAGTMMHFTKGINGDITSLRRNKNLYKFFNEVIVLQLKKSATDGQSFPRNEVLIIFHSFLFLFNLRKYLIHRSNIKLPGLPEVRFNENIFYFVWENTPRLKLSISVERIENNSFEYSYLGELKKQNSDEVELIIKRTGQSLGYFEQTDFIDLLKRIS